MSLQAFDDSLQLHLVFRLNSRPEHLARCLAEELPIALRVVGVLQLDILESVFDFRSQQIAVLEADVPGRTFEVKVDPFPSFEPVSALQARVRRGSLLCSGTCYSRCPQHGR